MRSVVFLIVLALSGAVYAQDAQNLALDLPLEMRTKNWGGGSCVHASTVNLLLNANKEDLAKWWRQTYSGGEYADRLIQRMEAANLNFVYTKSADLSFIRWACETRRGCGVFYKPMHAINVAAMDDQYVYLLDNNATNYPERNGHYERVPIQEFQSKWRGYGGFAWALLDTPLPPRPYLD